MDSVNGNQHVGQSQVQEMSGKPSQGLESSSKSVLDRKSSDIHIGFQDSSSGIPDASNRISDSELSANQVDRRRDVTERPAHGLPATSVPVSDCHGVQSFHDVAFRHKGCGDMRPSANEYQDVRTSASEKHDVIAKGQEELGDVTSTLIFFVNGTKVMESQPDPEMTLLTYLRNTLRLTGSKLGCGEGGCGACTVMVSHYNALTDSIHVNVNACLVPVCSMHGRAVTTVEGICTQDNNYLHPIQERLAKFHGSQCGFCTPGVVMSMYTLLRNNPEPTASEVETFFDGNLCRCTGYRPILDAFQTFTKEFKCGLGDNCCKSQKKTTCNGDAADGCSASFQQKVVRSLRPYDPTQEIIFPAELKVRHEELLSQGVTFQGPKVKWIQPQTLNRLLQLKSLHPNARLICGNTEIGIETKFKNQKYPILMSCSAIPELCDVRVLPDGVHIGASVTLTQMDLELKKIIITLPEHKTRTLAAFVEMLKWFASHQIRNVACLAGNIMTASPISDLIPLLVACHATAHLQSANTGSRSIPMDSNFFPGYRQTAAADHELLVSVTIPFTQVNEYVYGYKQANRKNDDIAVVNAGMSVTLSDDNKIQKMTIAFGGMGATVVLASQTTQAVIGQHWDRSLVVTVCALLVSDLPLPPGSPGGVARFRKTVALSFFFKFFVAVTSQRLDGEAVSDASAVGPLVQGVSEGLQVYGARDSRELTEHLAVGNSMPHLSAFQQCQGQAVYVDDMPYTQGELHLALVTSSKAHAHIRSIDVTQAMAMPGVRGLVSADDVTEQGNSMEGFMDTVFASKQVTCQGQVILAVLADTQALAREAARNVNIEYEERTPIITIEEAIQHDSYHGDPIVTSFGDLEAGFLSCAHVLEGECRLNGQNHFYLETMATRVVPLEDGEMEVISSTQNPHVMQAVIAKVLAVPMNKITVRVRRLGGGFGGKETQMLLSAVPAAIAARKTGQTVRCTLERDEDMVTTGNRHPFLARYKVGFTASGQIMALDLNLFSNGGNSLDLSLSVLTKAVLQLLMCYFIPNIRVTARVCQTNIMSNTAFRGFGGPQSYYIMESILENVADFLHLGPTAVREVNFYRPDDPLRFGEAHHGDLVTRCWKDCMVKSDYHRRRQEVDAYNRANRWKKKGLAMIPLKYGIAFTLQKLNQGAALVHIYLDGSVLLAHGGVEMGQGLHVKMAQIASQVLQVPIANIRNSETSTGQVPNTMPTASSVATDLFGTAVLNACETLKDRLAPFKNANPLGSWNDWVQAAFDDRVSLSATGFFRIPGITSPNFQTGQGHPFPYYTYGAACTEVHIDCLTGDHTVVQTDIVMDVGQSINPAIDVGQIQGAFMQGYGLYMLEEVKVTPDGHHLTQGPGTYKIPSFGNIPTRFNVHIVPDSHNSFAIFGSKGVGEPPLLLASSVFFAAKDAIRAARRDVGKDGIFRLDSPAMPDKIRLACQDQFTDYFPEEVAGTFRPWFVDL